MSDYTIKLRDVINFAGLDTVKSWFNSYRLEDYLLPKQLEIVQNSNVWSKEKLTQKIINHYYMREIGFETIELFAHFVKVTMSEIMEEKLPLIYTKCIEYDPLINVDFTETFDREIYGEGETEGTASSLSNSSNEGINLNNDTPQTAVSKDDIFSRKIYFFYFWFSKLW